MRPWALIVRDPIELLTSTAVCSQFSNCDGSHRLHRSCVDPNCSTLTSGSCVDPNCSILTSSRRASICKSDSIGQDYGQLPLCTLTLNAQTVNTDRETYESLKARVTMRWLVVSSGMIIGLRCYPVDHSSHAHVHTMQLACLVFNYRRMLERAHIWFSSKDSKLEWPCLCRALSMADPSSKQWHRMTDA